MTSAMNAVVTVKSIKVFGDSKEYPADEVTMKKFVKWAMETKADLRAHPMLNEQLRVLDHAVHHYRSNDCSLGMHCLATSGCTSYIPVRLG